MKKNALLFLFTALVFACSGSDDSNTNDVEVNLLLGTWIGEDVEYSGTTSFDYFGTTFETPFTGEAYDVDYTLTFTENPNEFTSEGSYSLEVTTNFLGETITENSEDLEFMGSGLWSQDGNQLITTESGVTTIFTIEELTETSLILSNTQTEEFTENDIDYTTTINIEMTFIKE
ncbi:hypothetical protein [Neotamlana laminarinivorans]|uniref:Lipocalin-like domain-containing protein n=1 Tax=Neotamlana laminarinivorans TaxID=2883124 RepID=A0A9X1I270_9FLAO|nr:hypothetical protein [Tamlana laminarinivorans]MCB4800065.1 hypothetical protein [Tamlana laminarinivorans]